MKKKPTQASIQATLNKKKKIKSLPNKPIPMGGGPFVGRHTTG